MNRWRHPIVRVVAALVLIPAVFIASVVAGVWLDNAWMNLAHGPDSPGHPFLGFLCGAIVGLFLSAVVGGWLAGLRWTDSGRSHER